MSLYDDAVLADNPVAYWKCQELTPPTPLPNLDLGDSANGFNGSLIPNSDGGLIQGLPGPLTTESPSYAMSGAIGRIPNAGGVNGSALEINDDQTWECIAKKTGVGVQTMLNRGANVVTDTYMAFGIAQTGLFVDNATFNLDWQSSGVAFGLQSCALANDTYYHIVGVRSGTLMELYVNGWLVDSRNDVPATPTDTGSNQPWRVGYMAHVILGAINRSAGMAYAAVYATALTQTQIRTHVVAAFGSLPDNPCGATPTIEVGCPNATGTVGEPYSSEVTVIGGTPPYTFAIIGGALPDGLTLDANTGAITGTPTTGGTFNFTVQVTDSDLITGESPGCQVVIEDSPPPPTNPPPTRTFQFDAGVGSQYYLVPQLSDAGLELRSKNMKAIYAVGRLTNAEVMGYAYDVTQPIKMDDLEAGVRSNTTNITRPQSFPDTTHVEQTARKPVNISGTLHTIRISGDDTGQPERDRIDQICYEIAEWGVRR